MMGSARLRFLEAASPRDDDEPVGLAAALQQVLELLKDPKKTEALTRKALDAAKTIDAARAEQAKLAKAHLDLDAERTAHAAVIAREVKEHQAALARGNSELEAARKLTAVDRENASRDAAEAAKLKAEMARRLRGVEAAMQGTA